MAFVIAIIGATIFVFGELAWQAGQFLGLGIYAACIIVLSIVALEWL
jgi:hypothetical protein